MEKRIFYPPLRDEFTKFGDRFTKIAHNPANGMYCYLTHPKRYGTNKNFMKKENNFNAGDVTNVHHYADNGIHVNKAISELDDMSPEMAVYVARMAASYIFPDLRASQCEEVVSTFELDTPNGKAYFIRIC